MATSLRLPKPYSPEELEALHRHAEPDVAAAMTFLEETGLRSAEFASITAEEARSWPRPGRFRHRYPRASTRITGKGDKERRVVLTREALEASRVLLADPNTNGRADMLMPWSLRGLRWKLQELGKVAGVHATPHRFRHTWITSLVEAGNPIEVVADMAGHSRTDTTRLYYLLSEERKLEAMRRRRGWVRRRRLRRS